MINQVFPESIPSSGVSYITMIGSGFTSHQGPTSCLFDIFSITHALIINSSLLLCPLPTLPQNRWVSVYYRQGPAITASLSPPRVWSFRAWLSQDLRIVSYFIFLLFEYFLELLNRIKHRFSTQISM